jgi:hypothetical protein
MGAFRFSEVDADSEIDYEEIIRSSIDRHCMGQVIWWDYMRWAVTAELRPGVGEYNLPCLQIVMGTRGAILGKQNYVWFFIAAHIFDTEATLDMAIQKGCENLATQRANQLNGSKPLDLQRREQ